MNGFRLEIQGEDWNCDELPMHYCGGKSYCDCPSCNRAMFTAFNLELVNSELSNLNQWSWERLIVTFCPSCAFYMKPYWIKQTSVSVVGGNLERPSTVINNVTDSYPVRKIQIREIAGNFDRKEYLTRSVEPGVYHQIGGRPFKSDTVSIGCCECGGKMEFLGILDYDDLNVPLYEDGHNPVALIIGDYDCMNLYSCIGCAVVGLVWAR